ncbi:hypothetical protein, partial [Kaarinaea lacus]
MRMCSNKLIIVVVIIALAATACSKEDEAKKEITPEVTAPAQTGQQSQTLLPEVQPEAPPAIPSGYKVIDSFNVGQNVYVRSMTVDPVARTLWIGTSVGVLEIDIQTRNMLN